MLDDIALIAQTRDDAAGEAFDKAAKLLGLGYPGGPVIDRLAAQGDPGAVDFPMPMASRKTLEFSFSGLKTALARYVQTRGVPEGEQAMADLCASFQRVIVESLVRKSLLACEREGLDRLIITGGVAANRGLRARAKEACDERGIQLFVLFDPFCRHSGGQATIDEGGVCEDARDPLQLPTSQHVRYAIKQVPAPYRETSPADS